MTWPAGRRFLVGLSTTGLSVAGSSAYWRSTIHADSHSPPHVDEDPKTQKTDPLADHDWMANGINWWHSVKIVRYDYASLPNKADRFTSLAFNAIHMDHGPNWVFAALCDGLRGWETSVFVFNSLIPTAAAVLSSLISKYTTPVGDTRKAHPSKELKSEVPSDAFDGCLKKAFLDVERGAVDQARDMIFSSPSKALNEIQLSAAIAGTTAMLTFYDDETRILKIANTGDARAVLGRRVKHDDGAHHFEVHVLSSEHTSANPSEQARLKEFHSNIDISVLRKYIGRDVTRAFGLAMFKWSQEVQERMHKEYFCEPPLRDFQRSDVDPTAEAEGQLFLTAEPEITTIQTQPDDFLIMGNQGLWKSLTSEEAVGLVGAWLLRRHQLLNAPILEPTDNDFMERELLPVDLRESSDDTIWYKRWKIPKRFIFVDNNAGTHLVRNALGGANVAFMGGLLKVPHPLSASARDEMTVTVIFFE